MKEMSPICLAALARQMDDLQDLALHNIPWKGGLQWPVRVFGQSG